MSKIVQAVNSMISNPHLISHVVKGNGETVFLYKNQYVWSTAKRDDGIALWFYPGETSVDHVVAMTYSGWNDDSPVVYYNASDIGTREAHASFKELYSVVQEKLYGIDKVLDDIISDNEIPF